MVMDSKLTNVGSILHWKRGGRGSAGEGVNVEWLYEVVEVVTSNVQREESPCKNIHIDDVIVFGGRRNHPWRICFFSFNSFCHRLGLFLSLLNISRLVVERQPPRGGDLKLE